MTQQKEDKHLAALRKERELHADELEAKQLEFERGVRERDRQHEHNIIDLREKIISLEGDLVDNSDDFRPASDDSLKSKYRELKLVVETITEPFNLQISGVPRTTRIDPDGFLAREGKNQLRFLLRSIVWEKVMDGFFSAPLGFGALGSGSGKKLLVNLFQHWRKIFDANPTAAPVGNYQEESFDVFRDDKEANKWRSATFQSIMMAVFPKGQRKGLASSGGMVGTFRTNRDKVYGEIRDILNEVCTNGVAEEIEEGIANIVRLAGELALEFGSQRTQLWLEGPEKGSSVQIGQDFVDCQDGDGNRGAREEVELVVSPKFFRVGDGRNDLSTVKIIYPGEIYPKQS
ncbi:hypothetical protein B0T25DRAFT_463207 [Lasiosphaeria hispida]|uniref:Uncharacterized protein n=1 Tax=Lasiosphaeria hispida TaxID=260671 RepID=A0AAJ0M980_9PEZI|nr:hypothetical protein B0T25DRAFT_463207 [Lasiosphaeria hispida]